MPLEAIMIPVFTSHNTRLDDGRLTKPDSCETTEDNPFFVSQKNLLQSIFCGQKNHLRLADLGCLEGGFSVAFARMGFTVLGIEVRDSNIAACHYVKDNIFMPNLTFVQDDVWNIKKYGSFDVMFCAGLLYHLDKPLSFLKIIAEATNKVLVLNTHFSTDEPSSTFPLSDIEENEGVPGRWFIEFKNEENFNNRDNHRWSSWGNKKSFWIKREFLIQALKDVGFDIVVEQYDTLAPNIAEAMTTGYYKTMSRGTFIGIKS